MHVKVFYAVSFGCVSTTVESKISMSTLNINKLTCITRRSKSTQARCTRYHIMWYSLLVTCDRSVIFSGYSTNKTYRHDITEILLKVALNTITINPCITRRSRNRYKQKPTELRRYMKTDSMSTFENKTQFC